MLTGRPTLSVLDLVPVTSGSSAREALDQSRDLARRVERAGYRRYWVAEHHLNPGVAGTSPAAGHRPHRRGHLVHPRRLGGGPDGAPHPPVGGRAVRHPRRRTPGPHRPRHRAIGLPPPAHRPDRLHAHTRAGAAHGPRAAAPLPRLPAGHPRFAPVRAPGPPAAAARRRDSRLRRTGGRRRATHRRVVPVGGGRRRARGPRTGRRGRDLDPGQQRRHQRGDRRGAGPSLRRQLPREPVLRARGGRRLPGGVPPLCDPGGALRRRLGRRGRGAHRRGGPPARHRLRALGAQHPQRGGRHPLPHPGGGGGLPLARRWATSS